MNVVDPVDIEIAKIDNLIFSAELKKKIHDLKENYSALKKQNNVPPDILNKGIEIISSLQQLNAKDIVDIASTKYTYTANDISSILDIKIKNLGNYATQCNFLLGGSSEGKIQGEDQIKYYLLVTPAIDTLTDSNQIVYYIDKFKQPRPGSNKKDDRKDIFDDLSHVFTYGKEIHIKILFPYNQSINHWLTGEIKIHHINSEFKIDIAAHDPYGQGEMDKDKYKQICNALKEKLIKSNSSVIVKFNSVESPYKARQHIADSVSSGAVVIEDLFKCILGINLNQATTYPIGVADIRIEHLNILRNHLTPYKISQALEIVHNCYKNLKSKLGNKPVEINEDPDLLLLEEKLKNYIKDNKKFETINHLENCIVDAQKYYDVLKNQITHHKIEDNAEVDSCIKQVNNLLKTANTQLNLAKKRYEKKEEGYKAILTNMSAPCTTKLCPILLELKQIILKIQHDKKSNEYINTQIDLTLTNRELEQPKAQFDTLNAKRNTLEKKAELIDAQVKEKIEDVEKINKENKDTLKNELFAGEYIEYLNNTLKSISQKTQLSAGELEQVKTCIAYSEELNLANLCFPAIQKNNNLIFKLIISQAPKYITSYKDEKGNSLLHFSSIHNNSTAARLLLDFNAESEQAALHNFIINGNTQELEPFFKWSNVNVLTSSDKDDFTILYRAVDRNDYELCNVILDVIPPDQKSSFINRKCKSKTALYLAAEKSYDKIVELLLTNNADPKLGFTRKTSDILEQAEISPIEIALMKNNNKVYLLLEKRSDRIDLLALKLAVAFGAVNCGAIDTLKKVFSEIQLNLLFSPKQIMGCRDNEGFTLFHRAILKFDLAITNLLIELGADVNKEGPFPYDQYFNKNQLKYINNWPKSSPLFYVANKSRELFIEVLLKANANPVYVYRETFIMPKDGPNIFLNRCVISTAISQGLSKETIHLLLSKINLSEQSRKYLNSYTERKSLLCWVIFENNVDVCAILLGRQSGSAKLPPLESVSMIDPSLGYLMNNRVIGNLVIALMKGRKPIVDMLKQVENIAPMLEKICNAFYAIESSDDKLLESILKSIKSEPLNEIKRYLNYKDYDGCTLLHKAIRKRAQNACKLLIVLGLDVNEKSDGCFAQTSDKSPLEMAIHANHNEIVKLLLDAGAAPDEILSNGDTLLRLAAEKSNDYIVEQILLKLAPDKLRMIIDKICAKDSKTTLYFAAENGYLKVCQILLRFNADTKIGVKNTLGVISSDPLTIAIRNEFTDIVDLIGKHNDNTPRTGRSNRK